MLLMKDEMDRARSMGEISTGNWFGRLKGRDHSEDLDVDRRIILKQILGK
jgi:hypothetical protein